MNENKIIIDSHFLVRVLKNEINDEEREFFYEWLNEKDENKEEFGQLALLWEKIAQIPTPLSPDLNLEWNKFQIKLFESISNENKTNLTKIYDPMFRTKSIIDKQIHKKYFYEHFRNQVIIARVAAAVLILFFVYLFLSQPLNVSEVIKEEKTKYYEFVTKRGERATVPLSDGSIVYLNAETKLIYPQFFDETNRFLKLEGEAYFSIKSDFHRPFIVQTGNKFIVVKGTEFNIKFRNNKLSVVVTKGRVVLYNQDSSKQVNLIKGQLSFGTEDGFTKPIVVDTRLYTAWRENKLSFVETPLTEVLEEIERFYNVDMICKNKKILSRTLTGYFHSNSLDEILNKISIALDFKVQRKGSKIFIF